jgi:hypothetical protein
MQETLLFSAGPEQSEAENEYSTQVDSKNNIYLLIPVFANLFKGVLDVFDLLIKVFIHVWFEHAIATTISMRQSLGISARTQRPRQIPSSLLHQQNYPHRRLVRERRLHCLRSECPEIRLKRYPRFSRPL